MFGENFRRVSARENVWGECSKIAGERDVTVTRENAGENVQKNVGENPFVQLTSRSTAKQLGEIK